MKKPILLILAAGMGSRFGGLKQLDEVGPSGEAIIDYSIYDAIQSGFGKIVFIIRKQHQEAFEARFGEKLKNRIDYEFVYQELDILPKNCTVPTEREKPLGTGHAIWCAKDAIDAPFVVINADDFYSKQAYQVMYKQLTTDTENYSMLAYYLENTLSDFGYVSRGVCEVDENNFLTSVTERTKISKKGDDIVFENEQSGKDEVLEPKTKVSMNIWGFNPDIFHWLEIELIEFLKQHGNELKSEFYIPSVVGHLIKTNKKKVKVLASAANWFGVTYKDDKPFVVSEIQKLVDAGIYPKKLWD